MRRGTRTAGAGEGAPACGAPSTAGVPRGVGPRLDNRPPTASRTGKGLRTLQRLDDLLQIGRGARLAAGQAQLGAAASAREPNPRRLAPPGRFQRRPQRPTPHQRPDGRQHPGGAACAHAVLHGRLRRRRQEDPSTPLRRSKPSSATEIHGPVERGLGRPGWSAGRRTRCASSTTGARAAVIRTATMVDADLALSHLK
ncbi:uncharacterized protein LOC120657515 [Panicum virgatum]|uniref:uncharacterized protein LOC120657515 n=1 Tax=Panicum virgatum TaxID=38727 RepID=UPI0019D50343|nr:uncharacterized protein LOC120657515 [Panicum virgatum]